MLAGAGVLVIVATLQADPSKATGFDAAVKTLGHAPFGKVLLVLAALGIAAFSACSFVRSRRGRMQALRRRAVGQRLVQRGDLHRLDRRVAVVLLVDQRRRDAA